MRYVPMSSWTTLLACLALAACGRGAPAPVPEQTGSGGPAFPGDKAAAGLTESILNGKTTDKRSTGALDYGTSLRLAADAAGGGEYALYRFNLGTQQLDSLIVDLQPIATTGAFIGLADQAAQRWQWRGPFTAAQSLLLTDGDYVSAAGNLWVAVVAPPGQQAVVQQLKARAYGPDGPPGNLPPAARLSSDVAAGNAPLTVNFDASASDDPDGSIVLYEWDWEDDGTFDASSAVPQIAHVFTQAGSPVTRVRTSDQFGAWDSAVRRIEVAPQPPNLLPYAAVSYLPYNGSAPLEVACDASASSDTDGSIALYEWDWNADGVYDESGGSPLAEHVFANPGLYSFGLRVTDDRGGTRVANQDWAVTVTPWWQPLPGGPQPGTSVYSAVAAGTVGGLPAAAVAADDDIRLLTAADPGGLAWNTAITVPARATGGTLSLATIAGRPALAYRNSKELRYIRALDAGGSAWGPQVILIPADVAGRPALLEVDGAPAIFYRAGESEHLTYLRALDAAGSAWSLPYTLSFGHSGSDPSAALVNGHPAAAWYETGGAPGLRYSRAFDSAGASWGFPQLVPGVDGYAPVLHIAAGRPALVCPGAGQLDYLRALDADGDAWSSALAIPLAGVDQLDARLVGGRPALAAYAAGQPLWFVQAADAAGSSWDAPQAVAGTHPQLPYPALLDCAGSPAILYYDGGLKLGMIQ